MAWIKSSNGSGYIVIYVANGVQIKKRVKKGADCIAAAPEVSKIGWTFLGWRADNRAVPQILPSKICDQKGIILYAIWSHTIQHGGIITIGGGTWGYDTNPDGSGKNWSSGAGGSCDRRCGYNCGVTDYHVWPGSGYNTPNGDGTYTPHPGSHGTLSYSWTKNDTSYSAG